MARERDKKQAETDAGNDLAKLDRVLDALGNQTVLTPALHRALVSKCKSGAWPVDCAFSCGIRPNTLKQLILLGTAEDAIEPYASFALEFLAAESRHAGEVLETVDSIRKGTFDDAKGAAVQLNAATWILENRYKWLWGGDALSAAAFVAQYLESEEDARKAKARDLLKKLPEATKKEMRAAGFVLP